MCNWRLGYFKRHTYVALREVGESEEVIQRCFCLGCRHQDCERWKQLWGRTAFPTDVSFEKLKDTAQSDAVGYALHILLDG